MRRRVVDIYFCLGFHEFLRSQEIHRKITGKSIYIYDIEVYGRRKLKKKRHSFFLQFDLIPHELCDSRHQLRAVEGFLVVALQDVGLVVVRLVVKKPSPMS